ncbi:hypothetical protein E4U13_002076 [Claviceps humidiphila]|uniref:Uncharacterized protein n=1 Tax=Claviceps humidiphila TaxID=1294629 RepID=A0A9P7TQQ6_9HYPO|nr:hypothetical protein E4U13_002076 [Claviceps humidiphila]
MTQPTSLLCSPQRQPSSQHTGQTKPRAHETDTNTAQQEVQLPEMRILEMLKLAQLEKGNPAMRPSWREAPEPQDTNGMLPSQGVSGDEAAESIVPPSGSAIREGHDARTKTESANIPSAPRLNRPRKRAYQMLEEEAGKILKGWTPSTHIVTTWRWYTWVSEKATSGEFRRCEGLDQFQVPRKTNTGLLGVHNISSRCFQNGMRHERSSPKQ